MSAHTEVDESACNSRVLLAHTDVRGDTGGIASGFLETARLKERGWLVEPHPAAT